MEELKQKSEPGMAFVGVLLLFVFGIMIFNDRPVQSPRPYDMPYPHPLDRNLSDYSYESWPWEDPFDFKLGDLKERDSYQIDIGELGKFIELKDNNKQELQIRLHKSLDGHDLMGEKIKDKDLCSIQIQEKLPQINKTNKSIRILASVVKVYPRTIENKENRTRQRYAVTAGLTASGYTASEPNRLNFCTSHEKPHKPHEEYNVRWEHFKHSSEDKDDVIVLWVDSDADIKMFKWPIDKYILSRLIFDFNNLIKEDSDLKWLKFLKFELVKSMYFDKQLEQSTPDILEKLLKELKLRRIGKDEVVLFTELGNVDMCEMAKKLSPPFTKGSATNGISGCNEIKNHFYYSKGLDANQQAIKKRDQPDNQGNDKNWNDYFSLHSHENPSIGHAQFDYLHRLSHQIKDINKASQRDSHKNKIKAIGIFGSDFYDKLIILEALWRENPNIIYFTTDLDAQMLQPEYWNWTRNLIVASHFDLQFHEDLQKPFPPFRDSRQAEIYYQILKHFPPDNPERKHRLENTKPSPLIFEIGRNGPVFLHQVNFCENDTKVINIRCSFSIPEIPTNNSINRNYDQQNELKYYLLFISLIAIALIFTESEMRPFSGAQTIWLSIVTLLLIGLMFYAVYDTEGEPLSFTDGVSIWPTILIRIFIFFLAFAFTIKLICALEVNFYELNNKDFLKKTLDNELKPLFLNRIISIRNCGKDTNSGKRSFKEFICSKPFLQSMIFMIFGMLCYAGVISVYYFDSTIIKNFLLPTSNQFIQHIESILLIAALIIISLLDRKEIIKIESIKDWAEEGTVNKSSEVDANDSSSSNQTQSFQQLWINYRKHGVPEQRLLRATVMWFIFMNIDIFLRHLFPESFSLCRGDTCTINYWVFTVSFSIVIFLTFLVLDAQRLCIHWIEKLHKNYPLCSGNDKKLTPEELIQLVADRTEVIDRLIYFPIILLMLMFLSRIVYFDYLDFPLSNGIVSMISISLLFYAGLKLRTEADELKWVVIENAKGQRPNKIIKKLEQFNYGAFQPMSEQPVVRSALLIIGSLGLFAAEYLMLFGY